MSLATAVAVVGFTVAVFFTPIWTGFEQERTGVSAITGYTPEQVRTVSARILADVVIGPPEFAAAIDGQPVLDVAERAHMVDVYNVMRVFEALVAVAFLTLIAIAWKKRRHGWMWRAVARGSGTLAIFGIVVGIAVVFFFDQAFLVFHLIVFPKGNFAFDPRTERLTQLFEDQFWTETSVGIALVGVVVAIGITLLARRRAGRLVD